MKEGSLHRPLSNLQDRLDGSTAWLDRIPLAGWLALCWAVCAAAMRFLPIFWNASDDIGMANLANGRLTGELESKLIFINPIWGLLLKGLYSLVRGVSWYPILFVLMQGFGWALFFRAAGLLSFGWQKWAWAFSIWVGLSFFALLQLQFTSVASFPATAAVLFIAAQVRRAGGPGHHLRLAWPALLCFWLSWLIRKEALFLVAAISVPLLIWLVLSEKTAFRKTLPALIVLAGLCGGAVGMENLAYADAKWQYYKDYNWMRGQLQDAKMIEYDTAAALMRDLGWTRNEHQLFYHFRQDRDVQFSLEPIRKLYAMKAALSQPESLAAKVQGEWEAIQFTGWAWTRFGLLALALLACAARRKADRAAIIGTVAAALGVAAAFILILILKDRVLLCLLFQGVATCFFLAFHGTQKRSLAGVGMLGLGAVLGLLSAKSAMSQGLATLRELPGTYAYLTKMEAPFKVNPVIDFYSGSLAVNDPFGHYRLPPAYQALKPIPTGWFSYSPFQAKAMAQVGYRHDNSLFLQAASDPRATFLLDPLTRQFLLGYLRERLGPDVRLEPASQRWDPATEKAVQYRVVRR